MPADYSSAAGGEYRDVRTMPSRRRFHSAAESPALLAFRIEVARDRRRAAAEHVQPFAVHVETTGAEHAPQGPLIRRPLGGDVAGEGPVGQELHEWEEIEIGVVGGESMEPAVLVDHALVDHV